MKAKRISAAALVATFVVSSAYGQKTPAVETVVPAARSSFVAASEPVRELRRSLLEKRWDYSRENRAAAAAEYAAIEASGEATPADRLLYGIVRFRQHEYAPASALLTSALASMPEDRLTLKTRIWTAVERGELDVVWPLLARLQRIVHARSKDAAVAADDLQDDLVFLGQMHGYLAGPYGELENGQLLTSMRDEVAASLPLENLRVFEAAERTVLERHERYLGEWKTLLADVAAAEKAEADAKVAALEARREAIKAEQAELDPARERVTGGSKESLNSLTEAEALVASSAETIARQAEALRIEHANAFRAYLLQDEVFQDRIRDWEERRRENPNAVFLPPLQIMNNLALLRANVMRVEQQMEMLQREHAGVQFQFEQIRQRRVSEEAELARELAKLQFDHAKLERELAALQQQAEKEGNPRRRNSAVLRDAEKTLTSVESYVDFSLETPREAALAALAGR